MNLLFEKTIGVFFFCCFACIGYGQQLEVHAGMALPETLNFGIHGVGNRFLGGISYGFLPGYDESLWTISGDIGLPYGRKSKKSKVKRSQVRLGLTYYREETPKVIFKDFFLYLRAGRNHFFSPKFGFGWEVGIAAKIAEDKEEKDVTLTTNTFDSLDDFLPTVALRFFFRTKSKSVSVQ